MITEQQLIAAGYTKFGGHPQWESAPFFYQKAHVDRVGTRYFLNFVYFPPLPYKWMAEMEIKNLTFQQHRAGLDLVVAEDLAEEFWIKIAGGVYYERIERVASEESPAPAF